MKRTVWITCAVIMLAVGVAGWWGLRRTAEPAVANGPEVNTQPAKVATAAGEPPEDAQSRKESEAANELLLSLAKIYGERPSVAPIEKILHESNDPIARKNALTDLLNVRYERAEAVRVLRQALDDASPSVRVRAAELLYTLGSRDGKGALLDVIRSGIQPETTHLSESVNAARILTQFREAISTDLLLQLYEQHPHPGLLETMAMQGDTRYFPILREALEDDPVSGNILNLGVLGSPDGFAVAKEIFESTTNEQRKVAAAWALFRTAGDRVALAFLINRAALGVTAPKPPELATSDSIPEARRAVYVTKDETVRDFLRQTVAAPMTDVGSSSLASLFYVQQDYEYVDMVVRKYFADRTAYPGIDDALIWRIAALRSAPDIEAAAQAKNPEAYKYYFVQLKGRTADGWIRGYLSRIPMR